MKNLRRFRFKLPVFAGAAFVALGAGLLLAGCGRPSSEPVTAADAKAQKYFCPMHPSYVSNRPGDCPICNMKLVPVGAETTGSALPSLPGRVAVHLDSTKRQLIGLSSSLVQTQRLVRQLRATAILTHDETTLMRIAPRFPGWVRKLHVNYVGQQVEAGAPLFTVYSPELFSAENDYLIARRASGGAPNNPEARQQIEAARRRLELMEVGSEEIRALEARGAASDEMVFRAPAAAHVISKSAVEGKSFMAGESLYEMAPLHKLWVLASLPEYELGAVRIGQNARVSFPRLDQPPIETTVAFINPHIDPQTRRGEVRLEVDNPHHELRPDMWAEVELEQVLGDLLTVPASAVIDTGERQVAFVDRADGHLEPREVKIGAKTDDYWEVRSGLNAGEKVVTRALFLVDSESQLKAVIAGMGAGSETKH